jgi:hypothetical protein
LACRKRYAVQDSYEFDDRERFEPAFEAVSAGHILRDPQTHALHVFFTKAGIVYFPRLETEPNLRMIDFIAAERLRVCWPFSPSLTEVAFPSVRGTPLSSDA